LVRGSDPPGRRTDSIETAFARGLGRCHLILDDRTIRFVRGWRCGGCGRDYVEPEPRLFRFNNPFGACPVCEGLGSVMELELDRVVPAPSESIRDGAIAPWNAPAYRAWLAELVEGSEALGVPVDVPFKRLSAKQKAVVLDGQPSLNFGGLVGFVRGLEAKK